MTTNTAILVIKSIQDRMWERMSSVECEAFEMAMKAMEKQIPKKPVCTFDSDVKVYWHSCPICKQGIGWGKQRDVKYCWKCGQKIDWSEEE